MSSIADVCRASSRILPSDTNTELIIARTNKVLGLFSAEMPSERRLEHILDQYAASQEPCQCWLDADFARQQFKKEVGRGVKLSLICVITHTD